MNRRIMAARSQAVELIEQFCRDQSGELIRLATRLGELFTDGGQLLIAGNGLLQPVAQLMASEFVFRLGFDRPALPAVCLGADAVLSARMVADGQFDQHLVRHYRALNSSQHLLLLLNDGSDAAALKALRDEILDNDQPVALVSAHCRNDPLLCEDINICLSLSTDVVQRQLELAQFAGHLLCELIEMELFGR